MSGVWIRIMLAAGVTAMVAPVNAQGKKMPAKFVFPGSPESASSGDKDARTASRARRGPRADAAIATFPGFRVLPGGASRIYVELTKGVTVDERRAQGMLVYVLHDARVLVRNNRNALLTTHFNTPVGRARLVTSGRDLELVIDLRAAANATQKVVAGEGGSARLEVDFPAGDYPPMPGMFEPPAKGRGEEPEPGGDSPSPHTPPTSAAPPAASTPPAAPSAPAPPPPAPTPPTPPTPPTR